MDIQDERCLIADASWPGLRSRLEESGATIYELDCADLTDESSFLSQAGLRLPADPARPFRKWSAFADALWSGLVQRPDRNIVLGWRNVDGLVHDDLAAFLTALYVVDDLRRTGVDPDSAGLDEPLNVSLVLTGEGPSFPEEPAAF